MTNTNLKTIFERLTGLDKIKEQTLAELKEAHRLAEEAKKTAEEAIQAAQQAKKEEELAKMTPKDRATANGEPYIDVIAVHANNENARNGFFELDWNDEFVTQLKLSGFGADGDADEEIVDRWFRTICIDVANESNINMSERGAGYINVRKLDDNRSEIS